MEGDHIKTYDWLAPLAWLYGAAVSVRNVMYDIGLRKARSFDVPVISVGNIAVGGTGKTPHTEYLIRLLTDAGMQVAVLSRGYKRKSSGFVLSTADTPMSDIGDEPYQMKHKYGHVHVAVDKDRRHGIERLMDSKVQPEVDVVILDDAYQHRKVQPGISILLTDYHRLFYYDKLLPAGRLREPKSGIDRADIVVVTKCPRYITPMDQHGIVQSMKTKSWQRVFFTTFRYGALYPLFDHSLPRLNVNAVKRREILLLSGIASPEQLEYDLSKMTTFTSLHFPDHHNFTPRDIAQINEQGRGKMIVTTEKDAARLMEIGREAFDDEVASSMYVLPVEVEFMNGKEDVFNQMITSYVKKNSRNSILLKGKDAHNA